MDANDALALAASIPLEQGDSIGEIIIQPANYQQGDWGCIVRRRDRTKAYLTGRGPTPQAALVAAMQGLEEAPKPTRTRQRPAAPVARVRTRNRETG